MKIESVQSKNPCESVIQTKGTSIIVTLSTDAND